ncbi:unnamed protein product [Musa hybrid cultivar]
MGNSWQARSTPHSAANPSAFPTTPPRSRRLHEATPTACSTMRRPISRTSWGGNGGRFMTSTHICEKYVLSSRSGSVGTRKSYYSTMFSLVMFAQTLVSSSGTVNYNAANQTSRNYSFKPYIFYFLISFWFISLQGVTSRDYWFKPY